MVFDDDEFVGLDFITSPTCSPISSLVSIVEEREAVIFPSYVTLALSPNSISLLLSLYISSSILMYLVTPASVLPPNSNASSTPTPAPTSHLSLASLRLPHPTTKCTTVSSTAPHSKQSTAPQKKIDSST